MILPDPSDDVEGDPTGDGPASHLRLLGRLLLLELYRARFIGWAPLRATLDDVDRIPCRNRAALREWITASCDLPPGALAAVTARVDRILEPSPPGTARDGADLPPECLDAVGAERYRDLRYLGHGGMGLVYDAYDPALQRRVALKFMRVDDLSHPVHEPATSPLQIRLGHAGTGTSAGWDDLRDRFFREARITGRIQHPSVLPIYEIGHTAGGVPYYAMKLLPSKRTLTDVLLPPGEGTLEERLFLLEVFVQICDAVGYAHSLGFVHRDLKPQNIGFDDSQMPYVLDWGLAKQIGDPPASPAGQRNPVEEPLGEASTSLIGTLGYMAPEVSQPGSVRDDRLADVFSLGVMLFQVLTGRLPYSRQIHEIPHRSMRAATDVTATAARAGVPEPLLRIAGRAMDPSPEARFPNAAELATALRDWRQRRIEEQELAEARGALEAARLIRGRARRREATRGLAGLARVDQWSALPEAGATARAELLRLQELGLREEAREGQRGLRIRIAVLAVLVVILLGILVRNHFETRRRTSAPPRPVGTVEIGSRPGSS